VVKSAPLLISLQYPPPTPTFIYSTQQQRINHGRLTVTAPLTYQIQFQRDGIKPSNEEESKQREQCFTKDLRRRLPRQSPQRTTHNHGLKQLWTKICSIDRLTLLMAKVKLAILRLRYGAPCKRVNKHSSNATQAVGASSCWPSLTDMGNIGYDETEG
jgi:hypothetical protein